MNRDEQVKRNHRLFELFMKEVLRDDVLAEVVPDKADIILLPDDDPELLAENQRLAADLGRQGRTPTLIRVRLVPQTRTVLMPEVELVSSPPS